MLESNSPSDLAVNMPNASLMYQTFTPTFGNLNFQIMPSQSGEVNNQFGTIPYLSLEALVYNQQIQAQTNQANTTSNSVSGQQNIIGLLTVTDTSGNVVASIGSGSVQSSGSSTTTTVTP